jgi:competence protein ComEC
MQTRRVFLLMLWFALPAFALVCLKLETICLGAATNVASNIAVHFIDVGQGDSILIDTPEKDVLIDGGPAAAGSVVLSYLGSLNITRIQIVIATHPHEDHIGGLSAILNSTISVNEIMVNGETYSSKTYNDFMTLAYSHSITVAQRGQTIVLTDTANLSVFNPIQPLEFSAANDHDYVNDNSIVVRLQAGNTSFLFTGDAEGDAEQSMLNAGLDLRSDVLKVGHHGSSYSTTGQFLSAVSPSYAIISVGENPYGHPAPSTIQRLISYGATVYETSQSGTIVASTDGTSITFQGNPQPIPEFPSVLPIFMLTALVTVTVCGRKRSLSLR